MPIFQIDMQFRYQTEYWTNKWFFICTDMADAMEAVNGLADKMSGNMPSVAVIDKARITPQPGVRNVYRDVTLNVPGQASWGAPAPLFNVVRVKTAGPYGRADQHYIRCVFPPSAIGPNQQFTAEYQGYNQALVTEIMDLTQVLCSHKGDAYTTASAVVLVGMRQLRRGSKRKARPVI